MAFSDNEDNNKVIRTWGTPCKERKIDNTLANPHHYKDSEWLGGYDQGRGTKLAGHRGYFLKGPGFLLNQDLINNGLRFLMSKGYTPIQPPYFIKRNIMVETAELADFDEILYKIQGKKTDAEEHYYLMATAEQPISTIYRGEWVERKDLPKKFAGISPFFRKKAGTHGKDTLDIFRIHQFEKVVQFVICEPEKSKELHEEIINVNQEFFETVNLPYRVINLVCGVLNNAAAKKIWPWSMVSWLLNIHGTFKLL